jgi:hypothetical protein
MGLLRNATTLLCCLIVVAVVIGVLGIKRARDRRK